MKKHWLLLILIVAIFLLLCWSLWWSNYGLKTVRYTVGGMSLPEGFNGYHIVQLSDLHSVSLGEENGRLLKAIRAEEPDTIIPAQQCLLQHMCNDYAGHTGQVKNILCDLMCRLGILSTGHLIRINVSPTNGIAFGPAPVKAPLFCGCTGRRSVL